MCYNKNQLYTYVLEISELKKLSLSESLKKYSKEDWFKDKHGFIDMFMKHVL